MSKATTITVVYGSPDAQGFYHAVTRFGDIGATGSSDSLERAIALALYQLSQNILKVHKRPDR